MSAETARLLALTETDPYWLRARETVHRRVIDLIDQHVTEQRHGFNHAKLLCGDPRRKWVAITFDDGPHPGYTERTLAILRQYRVPATFFVVGEMAERHPELVQAEAEAGHSVANHTYHHVSLPKIPVEYVATEIKACGEVIRSITGRAPHLFRPPGGDYDRTVAEASAALGYKMILWTDDPGDYLNPGQKRILSRTLNRLSNGGIILLHDGVEQTIQVLPRILDYLKQHGYRLVTIDDMLVGRQPAVASRR